MKAGDSQSGEREEAGDDEVPSGFTDTTAQSDSAPEDALQARGPQDGGAPASEHRKNTARDGGEPDEAVEGSEPPAGEAQHSEALDPEPEYVFDTERIRGS